MKTVIAMMVLPVLAACSGGGSNTPVVFNDQSQAGDKCQTPYFQEIAGVYDGEISYENEGIASCRWEVDFEVATYQDPNINFCHTRANITSTLLGGDNAACGDIAQGGDFLQPISGGSSIAQLQLESVSFPVEGNLGLNADTPEDRIYPTGYQYSTSLITVQFDGFGNIQYPASPVFSGVLVKQ